MILKQVPFYYLWYMGKGSLGFNWPVSSSIVLTVLVILTLLRQSCQTCLKIQFLCTTKNELQSKDHKKSTIQRSIYVKAQTQLVESKQNFMHWQMPKQHIELKGHSFFSHSFVGQRRMRIIILLIMKSLSKSYHQRQMSRTSAQSLPKEVLNHYKMVTTHLIDGIYQGFVNSSYQRDGFGVVQSQNYQTYLGYFKYNKIHGLGIIIYPDGSIIYGNFNLGKLEGIALTDNLREMQIGTYKHEGMIGIGFQFRYEEMSWKMCKYHKFVPIETITEEAIKKNDQIPQIFSVQPLILQHYLRYKTKQFFYNENQQEQNPLFTSTQDLNSVYYHQISNNIHFYGAMIEDRYEGIGVMYDPKQKQVLEAGMYTNGNLDGFGFKNQISSQIQLFGRYIKGKKEGLFIQKMSNKPKFIVFSHQQKVYQQQRQQNQSTYQKYQRIYNYRQKDFLSIRHGISFSELKSVFQTKDYKVWKLQLMNDTNKKQREPSAVKHKQGKDKLKTPPANPHSTGINAFQKSSLFIMKQKISSFTSKKKGYSGSKEKKLNLKIIETEELPKKSENGGKFEDYDQDQIGVQQNPLGEQPNQTSKKKFSFRKR